MHDLFSAVRPIFVTSATLLSAAMLSLAIGPLAVAEPPRSVLVIKPPASESRSTIGHTAVPPITFNIKTTAEPKAAAGAPSITTVPKILIPPAVAARPTVVPAPKLAAAATPFATPNVAAATFDATSIEIHFRPKVEPVNFQTPFADDAPTKSLRLDLTKDPCAALVDTPLGQLDISITQPAGKLPDDPATACWNQLNESAGPLAAARFWSRSMYQWNATCLCHRPLYFEEINLERHGYGCCECLQPAVSAAHFFGTIPVLPYCMAAECPGECVYTLGHYRPGSCPPLRYHWPPCDPLAVAAEGGVWTGMVFLIP